MKPEFPPFGNGSYKHRYNSVAMNHESKHYRIGAVSYLNSQPLVYGLEGIGSHLTVVYDLPGRLADRLAAGDLDVALIPTIEIFQDAGYTLVSDACIACRGPVWSVKLLSRCPLARIESIALDEGSRTSAALVRILLDQQFGIRPAIASLPINDDWHHNPCDAVLIIGDRAMRSDGAGDFQVQVDLGEWWYEWTGLPFVFAMWAARAGLGREGLEYLGNLLSNCRDQGLCHAEEIADMRAAGLSLDPAQCMDYFFNFLKFRFGANERRGLDLFLELATDAGLVPAVGELQFHVR